MNYIDLLLRKKNQFSAKSSLVEISKNYSKEMKKNSQKYEKDSERNH